MKLLIVTDLYPDQSNPVGGIFVKHQVLELQKHYDVYVFATHMLDGTSKMSLSRVPEGEYHHYFKMFRPLFFLNTIKYRILVIPRLKRVIRTFKPDLIHVHDCRHVPELVNLAPFLRKTGIPHYLTVHNIITHPSNIRNPLLRKIYRILLPITYRGWKHIFCVNRNLSRQIDDIASTSSTSVIGNAIVQFSHVTDSFIDKVSCFIRGADLKIISVGNLKYTKGFDLLIKAIAGIVREGKDIRLAIFGEGDQRAHLDSLIMEHGLLNKVCCFGSVENTLLRNLYPLFDAFILPSFSETFGVVYLEAMAAGIVTVGVRGQGIDGVIVHGKNGLLVEPMRVDSIENQIRWIMAYPSAARILGEAGKLLVERDYRIDQLCASIRRVYEA
ncbi:MAG: glycosyltransferase family 4 protein [Candidatus Cloacimonetes bacterium]|jgi:glycosyltransferase involved in cell wall biosynthesis|nr:glycosyltransferase family 4 protein [Candidatus Cloacimonadota bacterium]MDD2506663.1 glycosyltransferase family 4 protein [Candidatus Cloacimonadota bacterium]MDD4560279.1 glycosyltransferase family 4 protein [Candidatus Cloacimonadota bacterium]